MIPETSPTITRRMFLARARNIKLLLDGWIPGPVGAIGAPLRPDRSAPQSVIRTANFDPHPAGLPCERGGRVRFRLTAWVRSSALAKEPGPGKTMIVMRRRNPWPFPS